MADVALIMIDALAFESKHQDKVNFIRALTASPLSVGGVLPPSQAMRPATTETAIYRLSIINRSQTWTSKLFFQLQITAQIGIQKQTIANWEGNASQPPVQYIPAIILFLGMRPANLLL